jgi:hypothetical protein
MYFIHVSQELGSMSAFARRWTDPSPVCLSGKGFAGD